MKQKTVFAVLSSLVMILVLGTFLFVSGCGQSSTPSQTVSPTSKTPASTSSATSPISSLTQPAAKAIELRFNIQSVGQAEPDVYAPTMYFVDEVAKRTNGRVKVVMFWGATLAPPPETFDAVMKGICDLGESLVGYTRGRFPVTSACALPLGYPSSNVMSHVITDFLDKYKPAEWNDVVPIFYSTPAPMSLGTTKKPVRKAEDLKGLNLRVPSPEAATMFKELGVAPTVNPLPEVYELLSKGVLAGQIVAAGTWPSWKFDEICNYMTDLSFISPPNPMYLVMNKGTFNKLTPQDQQAILALGKEMIDVRSKSWDKSNVEAPAKFAAMAGKEVIKLPPEEQAKLKAAAQVAVDAWVKDMTTKGSPAVEWVTFIKERITYWSAKQ